jgi:hypothetical protein
MRTDNKMSIRIIAIPGLRVNKDICWPKGSEIRECTPAELKVLHKVPQSVCIFRDKQGNIINQEALNVHSDSKPKRKRTQRR